MCFEQYQLRNQTQNDVLHETFDFQPNHQIVQNITDGGEGRTDNRMNNSNVRHSFNSDIVACLTKQNLITERIVTFSEKPEVYLGWKATFCDVMTDINASEIEELDLLIRYLGKTSSRQIASIKASNPSNAKVGLEKAWKRLDTIYGSPEKIESALKWKLSNFQKITYKDKLKVYELSDTLNEIESVMGMPEYNAVFSYFNTSVGVNPILQKLPIGMQNKWRDRAISYKRQYEVVFPPFSFFCSFIQDQAAILNDPGFEYGHDQESHIQPYRKSPKNQVVVHKTAIAANTEANSRCVIHKADHPLDLCRSFKSMSLNEKRELLMKHGLCFRCVSGKHRVKECKENIKCETCNGKSHCTVMHDPKYVRPGSGQGGETSKTSQPANIDTKCTEICGKFGSKSCAKIFLTEIYNKYSNKPPMKLYIILDDQSNHSLGRKILFDTFAPNADSDLFKITTCNGVGMTECRKSTGFIIRLADGSTVEMPTVVECDSIPNNRSEIPTPEVARHYKHLNEIADEIPQLDNDSEILLIIGRDMLSVHHVIDQRIGKLDEPYGQLLSLGWAIIGESCSLDGVHGQSSINVLRTLVMPHAENSVLKPCPNKVKVTELLSQNDDLFKRTENDNQPALSVEDNLFLSIMDSEMEKDTDGNWMAPLPFRNDRELLPNNRNFAMNRAMSFDQNLIRNPQKCEHFQTFMQGLFDAGHIERAPKIDQFEESWYLPLFGVYHPQKKDRIRGVFDSSATLQGTSLNKVLIAGPDLMNNLLGVLLRFRRESVAIMDAIEQMFYCFRVHPDHRRYLRFLWHEDNLMDNPLVDYQMKVHVFGNSPSPAVATYGLRRTANEMESVYGTDMKEFVHKNFYVDDALSFHESSEEAISILKRTKSALQDGGNLRLHKIASNSEQALSSFDSKDLAKDIKNLDLGKESLPTQRSLGIQWNLELEYFTFKVNYEDKPFTRRGVLSSINSLYDPLGFAAPVTIAGKRLLREAMSDIQDWDTPLPMDY